MFEDRESQIKISKEILDAFDDGYDGIILAAPTGSGKSAIALQLNRLSNKSLLMMTSQKILQDQYTELLEGHPSAVTVKGQSNYFCRVDKDLTVDKAFCQYDPSSCEFRKRSGCEYWDKRKLASLVKITNTNYHLVWSLLGPNFDLKKDIGIFDEGHALEDVIIDMNTFKLEYKDIRVFQRCLRSVEMLDDEYRKTINEIIFEYEKIFAAKRRNYGMFKDLGNLFVESATQLDSYNMTHKKERTAYRLKETGKLLSFLDDKLRKYNALYDIDLVGNDNNLVMEWVTNEEKDKESISVTPIYIGTLFSKMVNEICDKFVIMSATILGGERLQKILGLSDKKIKIISLESVFPIENRKVLYKPIAKLNNTNFRPGNVAYERVLDEMKKTILHHRERDENGSVLAIYKHTEYLVESLTSFCRKQDIKLLWNRNAAERDRVLNTFRTAPGVKLLISPSFTEGVNFEDDISRYQIVPKVPYIAWNDYAQAKDRIHQLYYNINALKSIIQFCGRGNRHINDFSVNYIFDEKFGDIVRKCSSMLPIWWGNSVFEIVNEQERNMPYIKYKN